MSLIFVLLDSKDTPNEAVTVLQNYHTALSQALINPVQASQLLYSKGCINEKTLDEIETLESSHEDQKATLLTAISKLVSSDGKNLKVLTTALSKLKETRELAEKLLTEYGKHNEDVCA